MNIIHLSDLHFGRDVGSTAIRDALPDGGIWAKEWRRTQIKNLAMHLTQGGETKFEFIAFTGDLVHRNARRDVGEALSVISGIADCCCVPKGRRYASVGNHDFGGRTDSEVKVSRRQLTEAFRAAGWKTVPVTEKWWTVTRLGQAMLLMLESREWEEGKTSPSIRKVSARSISEILNGINREWRNGATDSLIVMSHDVPMFTLKGGFSIPTQATRAWSEAGSIYRAIVENTSINSIVWLCGDSHYSNIAPEPGSSRGRISAAGPMNVTEDMLMTGGKDIGVKYGTRSWPSARTIQSVRSDSEISFRDYIYMQTEGVDFSLYCARGEWKEALALSQRVDDLTEFVQRRQPQRIARRSSGKAKTQAKKKKPIQAHSKEALIEAATAPVSEIELEVMSPVLLSEIDSAIRREGLFDISWTNTHSREETLSWVPMSDLLIKQGFFFSITKVAADWVRRHIPVVVAEPRTVLVIGLDSWGSMIASQMGVLLGTGCVPSFSPNMKVWSDRAEGFASLRSKAMSHDYIVVVTDVIATGKTIEGVIKQLVAWNRGAKYYVVTVLINALITADNASLRLPKKVSYGIVCNSVPLLSGTLLKIPSLKGFCGHQYL